MDKERIEFCRKVSMMASGAGCVASLDTAGSLTRMISRSTEGKTVAGDFMATREEAVESWAKAFVAELKTP